MESNSKCPHCGEGIVDWSKPADRCIVELKAELAALERKADAWDEVVRLRNLMMDNKTFGYAVGERIDDFQKEAADGK